MCCPLNFLSSGGPFGNKGHRKEVRVGLGVEGEITQVGGDRTGRGPESGIGTLGLPVLKHTLSQIRRGKPLSDTGVR